MDENREMALIPGIGDIRIVPDVSISDDGKINFIKIHVARCTEILENSVVYRFLDEPGKKRFDKVPYGKVNEYGFLSMDLAIRHVLDSFMAEMLKIEKTISFTTFEISPELLEYFSKMQTLVSISKRILVEAERAKVVYSRYLANSRKEGKKKDNVRYMA